MNSFNSFIVTVCACCILIGILYIISPNGEISKTVKYLLSLVFIITVVGATKITVKTADLDFTVSQSEDISSEQLQISAAEYVYSYALTENGINFREITVCTDKSEDGSIVISKVIIYSDCEKEKIMQALGSNAEIREVEIVNE